METTRMAALGLLLVAAGCTTITPEEQRAKDEEECRGYGFRASGDAFAQCLLQLELDRRAARRAMSARLDHWDRPRPVVIYRQMPPPGTN
ncbi:MAG: hypothetical protein K5872_04660 [Rhizobiaceae bacterium]|nr:hypothetical protein [Rhizobiaceae bacterium]MCV0405501.1 hypothetical protein [Rhizobiaceae bacterium]